MTSRNCTSWRREDLAQLLVVLAEAVRCLALEVGKAFLNRPVRRGGAPKLDEGPH